MTQIGSFVERSLHRVDQLCEMSDQQRANVSLEIERLARESYELGAANERQQYLHFHDALRSVIRNQEILQADNAALKALVLELSTENRTMREQIEELTAKVQSLSSQLESGHAA